MRFFRRYILFNQGILLFVLQRRNFTKGEIPILNFWHRRRIFWKQSRSAVAQIDYWSFRKHPSEECFSHRELDDRIYKMFRFCAISNLNGEVKFSHYFESALCAVTNLEREIVQECLKTGDKQVDLINSLLF